MTELADGLRMVSAYLRYLWSSKDAHSIHSPFLFEFYGQAIRDKTPFYAFEVLESARQDLLKDQTEIDHPDFGAPSRKKKGARRRISDITRTAVSPRRDLELLFRMCNFLKGESILELGTSVGLSSAYLAKTGCRSVVTVDANPELTEYARRLHDRLGIRNSQVITGLFDEVLPNTLEEHGPFDFVYIDGNHTRKATLEYLSMIKPFLSEMALVVLDDIYWSKDMTHAWQEIQRDVDLSMSVDLFSKGMLFKRPGMAKQHFVLRK